MTIARKETATFDLSTDEFIPISRQEILAINTLPADVFLKISETKLILIGRQGANSLDDLHVLDNKKVSDFFVRKNDYKNCVGNNLIIAGIVIDKKEIPDPKKVEFLSRTVNSVFREIESVGFNHESLEHSRAVAKTIQNLVASKSDLQGVLALMADISDDLLRHSVAVSAISTMIARAMGWSLQPTLEKLALGGLLHDIGMKELPSEILSKARHELTLEERQAYETHVFRGVEILSSMPSVPDDVMAIALEHHENAIGQGYPRRLRDFKMNPLAKVVATADYFCELTLKSSHQLKVKSANEAILYIETSLGQPFAKPVFMGLKKALVRTSASTIKVVN